LHDPEHPSTFATAVPSTEPDLPRRAPATSDYELPLRMAPISAAAVTDPSLQRVPDADGRDPWQRPPAIEGVPRLEETRQGQRRRYLMLWHERETRSPQRGQLRVSVPLIGSAPAPDFGYRVGRELDHLWVQQPVPGIAPITAVAAHVGEARGRRNLVLLITLGGTGHDRRVDGSAMARSLDLAVEQASNPERPTLGAAPISVRASTSTTGR
jgi:hypothetical protein